MKLRYNALVALCSVLAGCGSDEKSDGEFQGNIMSGIHDILLSDVRGLHQAALELQASAPSPSGRGWDATQDATAINDMKQAWIRARTAWEPAEGVLAPLFPDIDSPLDSRYEDFLQAPGATGDDNLFDGEGVTGMHAIERILFALETTPAVAAREASIPGYQPAAWPGSEAEADQFKNGLCARLVADSQHLVDRWEPRAIDLRGAFQGLTRLMNEQQEKVILAANHEEESRYAQRTLADLRDNLLGTRAVYALFVPWLATKPFGDTTNNDVQQAFERLDHTYGTVQGDAIPPPPSDWRSDFPSANDQDSPFGRLYLAVVQEVDVHRAGSAVDAMNHVARILSLPEFTGEN